MHRDFDPPRSINERFHDLIEHSMIWVWLLFWSMEAFMNARFGWRLVGGGLPGVPMGSLLLGIAMIGAYLPMRFRDVARHDPRRKSKRFMFGLLAALCFAVCQVSGWANLGTMLADGATARTTKATERATAAEAVQRLRDEQSAMAAPRRTVEAIEAALSLELRRTSARFPNGDGPEALKLKQELAHAKRYHELPGLIDQKTRALGATEQVAEGRPELDVLKAIFVGAGEQGIAFWIPPVLTFLIGVFATFGPVLIGLKIPASSAAQPHAPAGHLPPADIFDAFRGGNPFDPHGRAPPQSYAYRMPQAPYAPGGRLPAGESPGATNDARGATNNAGNPVSHVQPQLQASPAAAPNAPITINVGGATSNGAGAGGGMAPGEGLSRGAAARRVVRRPAHEEGRAPGASGFHAPAVSPAANQQPVDRDRLNTVLDQLVTFAAAELVADAGALVPFADMVERYRHWAQGRGIDPAAFAIMFPAATGIALVDIAGAQHFAGARLRQHLKVVGG